MRIEDLETFLCVAKHQNVSTAAQELRLKQPTVSERVKELGNELGVQLIKRSKGSGVVLTDAGERLLHYAQQLVALAAEAKTRCLEDEWGLPRARIGVNESVAHSWLGDWLAYLRREHPGHAFDLKVGTTDELGTLLVAGELDLVVGTREFAGHKIKTRGLAALEMVFVGNAQHHRKSSYTLKELAEEGFVTFQVGSTPYVDLMSLLRREDLRRCRVDTSSSVTMMAQQVAGKEGVATLPRLFVEKANNPSLGILTCGTQLAPLPCALSWRIDFLEKQTLRAIDSLSAFLEQKPALLGKTTRKPSGTRAHQ